LQHDQKGSGRFSVSSLLSYSSASSQELLRWAGSMGRGREAYPAPEQS